MPPLTPLGRQRLERAAELKADLVEFALTPPLQKPLREQVRNLGHLPLEGEARMVHAVEALLFEYRYADGSSVLDRYLARGPGRALGTSDTALVAGWADSVHGIFEVVERGAELTLLLNLFDEMEYPAYASAGIHQLRDPDAGSFLLTRLLPVDDLWTFSGEQVPYPPGSRPEIAKLVADQTLQRPELVLRNPHRLEQARVQARSMHESFVACFGNDQLSVNGDQVAATYRRHLAFHTQRTAPEQDGPGLAERLVGQADYDEVMDPNRQVLIVSRPDTGVTFLVDHPLFEEAFATPLLVRDSRRHRDVVRGYLEDGSIPAWVFEDVARRYGAGADTTLRLVLRRSSFRWEQDGPELMRRHGHSGPPSVVLTPGVTPAPSIALEHYRAEGHIDQPR